jgi:hypothetical protein
MATEFEKLIVLKQGLTYVFNHMTIEQRIFFISALISMIGVFYGLVISPIIFNYFLIPKIEKKIGKKLGHHPFLDYIFLGVWSCRQNEIAIYIINRCWALMVRNDHGLPMYCNRFALKKVGYTIDMASKAEIFFSVMLILSGIITVVSAIVSLFTSGQITIFTHK